MVKREPVELPIGLVAVAIDTNSTGADLQLSRLAKLADLLDEQELDEVQIWVPEPVVWEWAEHIHRKFESIGVTADQLVKTGLPEFRALSDISANSVFEIVKSIERALRRSLIWRSCASTSRRRLRSRGCAIRSCRRVSAGARGQKAQRPAPPIAPAFSSSRLLLTATSKIVLSSSRLTETRFATSPAKGGANLVA